MVASVQNIKRLIKHLLYAYLSFLNFLKKYLTNTFSTARVVSDKVFCFKTYDALLRLLGEQARTLDAAFL
jgi:hypothetical protein